MRLASFCGPRGNIQSLAVSEKQVEAWPGGKFRINFIFQCREAGFCKLQSLCLDSVKHILMADIYINF